MRRILHIFKSPPDESVRRLAEALSQASQEKGEVHLYQGAVDYHQLLELVFEHDRVICWW